MMGRQRNNAQLKGNVKSSERLLNEIEGNQLQDIEFKTMVIRNFNDVIKN